MLPYAIWCTGLRRGRAAWWWLGAEGANALRFRSTGWGGVYLCIFAPDVNLGQTKVTQLIAAYPAAAPNQPQCSFPVDKGFNARYRKCCAQGLCFVLLWLCFMLACKAGLRPPCPSCLPAYHSYGTRIVCSRAAPSPSGSVTPRSGPRSGSVVLEGCALHIVDLYHPDSGPRSGSVVLEGCALPIMDLCLCD